MKKLVLIILIVVSFYFISSKPSAESQIYVSAKIKVQEQNLIESGHVTPAIQYSVVSGSSGNLLNILPNNTNVKKRQFNSLF